MAKVNLLLCSTIVLVCVVISSGSITPNVIKEKTWCVAKQDAPEDKLKDFIESMRTDPNGEHCIDLIFIGSPCYEPNTVRDHASVCLNEFYKSTHYCRPDIGQTTTTDPSHGTCTFK